MLRVLARYSIVKELLAGVLCRYGLLPVKLVIQTRRATLAGCAADLREHGALHHLIRSDQRLFGFSEGTGAAINVGSAYRLFLGIVPLRGSSTEGLSGQFMIGATDSYD